VRRPLRGVVSRVSRLAQRLRLSSEELTVARLRAMTDEELYAEMIADARAAGGLEVLLDVCRDLPAEVLTDLRERWERSQER